MFEPLPALIRAERERQNLTQEKLAKLAKISRSRLASLEKGDDNLSLKLLLKVANTLGMTELRIGGLHVEAAPPDLAIILAAANAIETARRMVEQTLEAREDLDRAAASVAELLDRVLQPLPNLDLSKAIDRLMASGDALRDLAEDRDAPARPRVPAAKASARKAGR